MEERPLHQDWTPVGDGEFAGWMNWPSDNWESHGGPFYFREEDGRVRCAFRAEKKHMNGQGHMHGGAMMTFADFSTFGIAARDLGGGAAVTVSMNCDFIRTAQVGDLIEATGEVTKAGKRLIFVEGKISTGGAVILSFSAVLMRVG